MPRARQRNLLTCGARTGEMMKLMRSGARGRNEVFDWRSVVRWWWRSRWQDRIWDEEGHTFEVWLDKKEEFLQVWQTFEVSHGNEDTFREMLRIKRSVRDKYSTASSFNIPLSGDTAEVAAAAAGDPMAQLQKDVQFVRGRQEISWLYFYILIMLFCIICSEKIKVNKKTDKYVSNRSFVDRLSK